MAWPSARSARRGILCGIREWRERPCLGRQREALLGGPLRNLGCSMRRSSGRKHSSSSFLRPMSLSPSDHVTLEVTSAALVAIPPGAP
ncbi:hypothetical protein Micbo1qcDRAFT_162071, partial [Microdochium bolleyi]